MNAAKNQLSILKIRLGQSDKEGHSSSVLTQSEREVLPHRTGFSILVLYAISSP